MRANQLIEALQVCLQTKQPAVVWGDPGIGKSQIIAQVAKANGMQLNDQRCTLLDPVDLRGLPHVNGDGRSHWAQPDFLPRDGKGILFFDEMNRAVQLVQSATLQLVLDRKLGEYSLPDDWVVWMACNPSGVGVNPMSPALKNRLIHFYLEPHLDDFVEWANRSDIHPIVIAMLRFRPELLYRFDSKDNAFPTPRSWAALSALVSQNPSRSIEEDLYAGAIGKGATTEFLAFLRLSRELPDIDTLLADPAHSELPKSPQTKFAVAAAMGRKLTNLNAKAVFAYINRMESEYQVLSVHDSTARDPKLAGMSEMTKWFDKNKEVFKP